MLLRYRYIRMLVRHLSWAKLLEKDKVPQQGPLLLVCGEHGPQQGLEMVSERWMGEKATVVFSSGLVGDGVKNRRGTNQGDTERFYSRTLFFSSVFIGFYCCSTPRCHLKLSRVYMRIK